MKTVCLVMIVKNEGAVIRRCLDSVRGIIDYWVVCDTGSTDSTQEIVRETLSTVAGRLEETPWVNFGHNRNLALELAKGRADYHLLIDADMTVNVQDEFRNKLTADSYLLRHEGTCEYWVERLVSDRHHWTYRGATHECICSDTAQTREKLFALSINHHEDGGTRADKYQRDIAMLKEELAKDPYNARSIFYLAQSYRDIGNLAQAMEGYEQRASMGGWDEEVWYSLYQVARLRHRFGMAWPLVLNAYLTAYQYRRTRLEPLFYLARFYRQTQEYALGYLFSRAVVDAPYPEDILFVEKNIYEYGLPLEYALCCSELGMKREAARVASEVLSRPGVPAEARELVKNFLRL